MFSSQVNTDIYVQDIFFALCSVSVLIAVVGLAFVDVGLSRQKNVVDSVVQKLVAGCCCAGGFLFIGFAVWNWQFNQAFGIKNPLGQSISDWWLAGPNVSKLPQALDPKIVPSADVLVTFIGFFLVFGFLYGAFFHSIANERMRPLSLYIMSFVVGLVGLALQCVPPLGLDQSADERRRTRLRWCLQRLYLRRGMGRRDGDETRAPDRRLQRRPRRRASAPAQLVSRNLGRSVVPGGLASSRAWLRVHRPGTGCSGHLDGKWRIGAHFALNVLVSIIGGGVVGALIAYRRKEPLWALFGPITGYVAGTSIFATVAPWKMLLISMGGPIVCFATSRVVNRLFWC